MWQWQWTFLVCGPHLPTPSHVYGARTTADTIVDSMLFKWKSIYKRLNEFNFRPEPQSQASSWDDAEKVLVKEHVLRSFDKQIIIHCRMRQSLSIFVFLFVDERRRTPKYIYRGFDRRWIEHHSEMSTSYNFGQNPLIFTFTNWQTLPKWLFCRAMKMLWKSIESIACFFFHQKHRKESFAFELKHDTIHQWAITIWMNRLVKNIVGFPRWRDSEAYKSVKAGTNGYNSRSCNIFAVTPAIFTDKCCCYFG